MDTYEQALLVVARAYTAAVNELGGKSLARVSTIVVNRGSFFDSLETGATCSVRNYEKFARYFGDPANWPNGEIPSHAASALRSVGRPASQPVDPRSPFPVRSGGKIETVTA